MQKPPSRVIPSHAHNVTQHHKSRFKDAAWISHGNIWTKIKKEESGKKKKTQVVMPMGFGGCRTRFGNRSGLLLFSRAPTLRFGLFLFCFVFFSFDSILENRSRPSASRLF